MIKAYCDSSFDERLNVAGIGVVIREGEKERVYSTWTKCCSNNEGELFAIHLAGILTEGRGIIYTDSQTAISYIKSEIKDKPRTHEQYIRHKHCEYWARQIRCRNIQVEKIKGHEKKFQSHCMGNRLADLLAQAGRGKFYEKNFTKTLQL